VIVLFLLFRVLDRDSEHKTGLRCG